VERRLSARKNLDLRVILEIPSYNTQRVSATLHDISSRGAFINTQVPLPSNAPLFLELKLSGNSAQYNFRLNSKMIHSTSRGMGLSFVNIPAGVINTLSDALSQYEKQFEPVAGMNI
jgi:hypothetical protein